MSAVDCCGWRDGAVILAECKKCTTTIGTRKKMLTRMCSLHSSLAFLTVLLYAAMFASFLTGVGFRIMLLALTVHLRAKVHSLIYKIYFVTSNESIDQKQYIHGTF